MMRTYGRTTRPSSTPPRQHRPSRHLCLGQHWSQGAQGIRGEYRLPRCPAVGHLSSRAAGKGSDTLNPDLAYGDYVLSLEKRSVKDVRGDRARCRERPALCRGRAHFGDQFKPLPEFCPAVGSSGDTSQSARLLARLHPLRLSYELASDRNPGMGWIASEAQKVREERAGVSRQSFPASAGEAFACDPSFARSMASMA